MTDVENEIVEQHRLIEAILRGDGGDGGDGGEATIEQFAEVLAADFRWYMPDGDVRVRDELVSEIGRLRGSAPGVVVTIKSVRPVTIDSKTVVATYEEHQVAPGMTTARRSTAVFVRDSSARHGLFWQHLHETWLAV